MERYIEISDQIYYDSVWNKFVKSKKKLHSEVPKNLCRFIPPYNKELVENNLSLSRQQLILCSTEQCNLRCEYCIYYDTKYQGTDSLKKMEFETAKKAIIEFLENSKVSPRRCISFYGGEPLLNFDLIKACVEFVESQNLLHDMDFTITTNGVLLNKEIADFLYLHRFIVSVSIDGPKEIHNRYRKSPRMNDSFDTIIENINYLISTDPNYWRESLDFIGVLAPPVDIETISDFFEITPYRFTLLNCDITHHMKELLSQFTIDSIEDDEEKSYQIMYLENKPRTNSAFILEAQLTKDQINKKPYLPFSVGRYCIPGLKRTFVSVDGDYYICEKDDQNRNHIIGNINTGIDHEKLVKLSQEAKQFHEDHCTDCWASRFCPMCFASMSEYPYCCERFKSSTKEAMRAILEGKA